MRLTLLATAAALALGTATAAPAAAQLLDTGSGSHQTDRMAGSGTGQGVDVLTATTLTQIGFWLGTSAPNTLVKYLIWDGASNSLAYSQTRTIATPVAAGTLVLSDVFSFGLQAGRTYFFGIIADDAMSVDFFFPTMALEENGLRLNNPNINFLGFDTPRADPPAGATIALQLYGTQSVVPEPATVGLFGTGLVALGVAARRRGRRARD